MKKKLRRVAWVLGALLLVLLLAVAAVLLYLRTSAGAELLRARAEAALNGALQGKLSIGKASLLGQTVVLEYVRLYTPEGELVAVARRLEVTGDIPGLFSGTIALKDCKADGLHVFFKRDARGLNLIRAVSAKIPPRPREPGAPEKESGLDIDVEKLTLTDGLFEYQDSGRTVRIKDLSGVGKAKIHAGPFDIDSDLDWKGVFEEPVKGPMVLRGFAKGSEKTFQASVFAEGGGLKADASLSLSTQDLTIKALEVNEALGRAVLGPAWPRGKVHLEGKASAGAADLRADLDGRTKAHVTGRYDFERFRVDEARVELKDVDLAQLKEGLKETRIDATVTGALGDLRPDTLTGSAKLQAGWRSPRGARVGEAVASLTAANGEVTVESLAADVPGARAEVNGTASQAKLDLRGHLEAKDAGLGLRTVLEALGIEPFELTASGNLDVAVAGPVLDPSVRIFGRLPYVAVGALRATGLDLAGALPSVRRWREVDATLAAQKLEAGENTFEAVKLGLATRGREVSLDLSSKGLNAVLLRATGRFEGREALSLGTLGLEWPGTTWAMEAPSRVSWATGFDLEAVKLRAGNQGLEGEVHVKGGRLDARVALVSVDLARLPAALVPEKLGVAGLVSGTVVAEGSQKSAQVLGTLEVKGGRISAVDGIDARVEARLDAGRLKGTLAATSHHARAEGSYDFPLLLGSAPVDAPLSLALQLDELPIEKLLLAAGAPQVVTGPLRAGMTVQGTVGDVKVALDASTLGAVLKQSGREDIPLHSVSLFVETRPDGTPLASAEVTTLGATLKVDATTPARLSELLRDPPRGERAKALEFSADASLTGLSLVSARPLLPESMHELSGTLAITAQARGSASNPALDARVMVADFSSREFKPIQLGLEVKAADELAATLTATMKDKQLLTLAATSSLGLSKVLRNAVEPNESLQLQGSVGPMDLTQVAELRGDEGGGPITGLVQAAISGGGTLGAPVVDLKAVLEKLTLRKVALGRATVGITYGAEKTALKLAMVSTNGGQLQAKAELQQDFGLGALKKGVAPLEAAVSGTLASRGFDLAFLSGAHATLRSLGGYVTADASFDGKLGSPTFDGALTWNKGRLGIAGFTEFRDVELSVWGNTDKVGVDKLDARSGAGTVSIKGTGTRQGKSVWAFNGSLESERLPIVADDQLRFILDVKSTLEGELSPLLWNVRRLSIPMAHVQLPVLRKKDTQALDRPRDIVLVREGVALGPRPRRWKQKAQTAVASATAQQRERVLRVAIDAPLNLWVRGNDVNLEAGLSDGFTVEYDRQLFLNGTVKVIRGKVSVIGRDFEVQNGSTVTFTGPPAVPSLNVTAVHTNYREKVTVYATLVGTGDDFTFRTSSTPALSESEIYTLLATGRRSLRRGSGAAISGEQSLSVLGAVMAAQLKTALAQKLPVQIFDVLEISAGADGFSGTRLEAGKYLTDRLYIGYVGQLSADPRKGENGNAGRIEYQFAPGWSVQATAGDAPAGSAELVWGVEF